MGDPGSSNRLEKTVNDFRVEMASSVATIVEKLDGMKDHSGRIQALEVKQKSMSDRMDADDRLALTTAKALKDADEARRLAEDIAWLTPTRIVLILGGIATIVTLLLAFVKL